jgi:hypothetical protein
MPTENKIKTNKTLKFIILYGLICGLALSFNILLANLISYLAIFTYFILLFFIFHFFIKTYKRIIGVDVKVVNSLIVGFPVFLIGWGIFQFFSEVGSIHHYTNHGKQKLLVEWLEYAALMTIIQAFVFVPIYKLIKRRKIVARTKGDS